MRRFEMTRNRERAIIQRNSDTIGNATRLDNAYSRWLKRNNKRHTEPLFQAFMSTYRPRS